MLTTRTKWMSPSFPERTNSTAFRTYGALRHCVPSWTTRPYVRALEARQLRHVLVGGSSFHARDPQALEEVFARIDALEKTEFTSTRLVRYRERFEPWALAAFLLVLGGVVVESIAGSTPW
jgi:Ca-activated chloride channel family protein